MAERLVGAYAPRWPAALAALVTPERAVAALAHALPGVLLPLLKPVRADRFAFAPAGFVWTPAEGGGGGGGGGGGSAWAPPTAPSRDLSRAPAEEAGATVGARQPMPESGSVPVCVARDRSAWTPGLPIDDFGAVPRNADSQPDNCADRANCMQKNANTVSQLWLQDHMAARRRRYCVETVTQLLQRTR
jgi:hypothetical protein